MRTSVSIECIVPVINFTIIINNCCRFNLAAVGKSGAAGVALSLQEGLTAKCWQTRQNVDFWRVFGLLALASYLGTALRGDSPRTLTFWKIQKRVRPAMSTCHKRFNDFFQKVDEPRNEEMCCNRYKNRKNYFVDFLKLNFLLTFGLVKDEP